MRGSWRWSGRRRGSWRWTSTCSSPQLNGYKLGCIEDVAAARLGANNGTPSIDKPKIDRRGKRVVKRVAWADEVGGTLLSIREFQEESELTPTGVGKGRVRELGREVNVKTLREKIGISFQGFDKKGRGRVAGDSGSSAFTVGRSYKEALLRDISTLPPKTPPTPWLSGDRRSKQRFERSSNSRRCFRCLASDHLIGECRDPVKCLRCRKTGHRAFDCREPDSRSKVSMNRAFRQRERVPKVYVPYTEEYLRRREYRRNAVLADVIPPANLGSDPLQTIASALARRFGGYTQDFAVARYRDRDYAIFLPEWVSAEVLARREVLTLDGFWIRCYEWGQYRTARPHRVCFKAWIRLINLPFECWTVARVAALVGGFGRFIKADDTTKAMTDLRAFRCQINLDSLREIPQNLSIVLGEEIFSVMVHLESWERVAAGNGGEPPAPPRDGAEMGNQDPGPGDRRGRAQGNNGQVRADEEMGEGAGELVDAGSVNSVNRVLSASSLPRISGSTLPWTAYGSHRSRSHRSTPEDGGGAVRWVERLGTVREAAAPKPETREAVAPKPKTRSGKVAAPLLEQAARRHLVPFPKISFPAQLISDPPRASCRKSMMASRQDGGKAFIGFGQLSGITKPILLFFWWSGSHVMLLKLGGSPVALFGPTFRAQLPNPFWASLLGPVAGVVSSLHLSGGLSLRATVGSTGSRLTQRTGLSDTIDAGGVLFQEAMSGVSNRFSEDLEDALLMERDGTTHSLSYPNDATVEDPPVWSRDVVVAGKLDRGIGSNCGIGDGPRTSARLATREKGSILSKAISRKARLRGGGAIFVDELSPRKIIQKSRLCGVILDGTEAAHLAQFMKDCA
ncbi:uncharacterized protein LOC109726877 [Ananas comosus]|uniref:Uncharacterized protein LOC109726877 n=1 Tax=Ananas comosus TaxID=4615 RepID=A0A6P5GWL8_ANACO|nr:uncharacterized protein LOC109726877 [Ananas comosus]